jgi:hypothetical protein
MKANLSLVLLALLVGSTASVFAEVELAGPGVIARTVEREAARLAQTGPSSTIASTAQRQTGLGLSAWSRIFSLEPGTEILLYRAGSPLRKQRLLDADEAGLTILNVDDPAIPSVVSGVLVSTARDHPEYFEAAQVGRQFALSKGVRLGPDGVFYANRRLFDIAHVMESVPRDDVVEVSVLAKHIGEHARRGVLIGGVAGATILGLLATSCSPHGEPGYCNVAGMAVMGAVMGGVMGLEYGTIVGLVAPRSPNVIYRRYRPPDSFNAGRLTDTLGGSFTAR